MTVEILNILCLEVSPQPAATSYGVLPTGGGAATSIEASAHGHTALKRVKAIMYQLKRVNCYCEEMRIVKENPARKR